jgi:hypothetical protein
LLHWHDGRLDVAWPVASAPSAGGFALDLSGGWLSAVCIGAFPGSMPNRLRPAMPASLVVLEWSRTSVSFVVGVSIGGGEILLVVNPMSRNEGVKSVDASIVPSCHADTCIAFEYALSSERMGR